jgi:hypothetical protein
MSRRLLALGPAFFTDADRKGAKRENHLTAKNSEIRRNRFNRCFPRVFLLSAVKDDNSNLKYSTLF